MRNHRLVTLLAAAAVTTTAGLAAASPAQVEDQIVKLVSAENGGYHASTATFHAGSHPGTHGRCRLSDDQGQLARRGGGLG
jgi:hypothetical protein